MGFKLGLFRCESCSVVVSPAIWEEGANSTLEEEWFGEDYSPATSFWVSLFENWNNRKTLSRLAGTTLARKRLLEVGVGSGSFLNAATQQGYEVTGCDLSPPICERVTRQYDIQMYCSSLADIPDENLFDVIVMNHVLEHVENPISFLQDAERLLTQAGLMHIAVPNISCWEASLRGWTSFEPYHLTYFNQRTLQQVISHAHLTTKHMFTHESFSGWFLSLLRTMLGVNQENGAVIRNETAVAGHATGQRRWLIEHLYRISMVCAGGILWPMRWLQAKLGRGDEVICLASKVDSPYSE